MGELEKYHAQGIHQRNGRKCSHLSILCSCGNCDNDDNLQCEDKPYESRFVLFCQFQSLSSKIECETSVIYPVMGWRHSNVCEATFNVILRFCAKSFVTHYLLYITLYNWGLIKICSPDPSPYVSLFEHMGLPILDYMEEIWEEHM